MSSPVDWARWDDDPTQAPDIIIHKNTKAMLSNLPIPLVRQVIIAWGASSYMGVSESKMRKLPLSEEEQLRFAESVPRRWAYQNRPDLFDLLEEWRSLRPPKVRPLNETPHELWLTHSKCKQYKIEQAEARKRLAAAEYACEICRYEFRTQWEVRFDHNHSTGEFRGFLCQNCNTGIGLLRDSPSICASAFAYLEERGFYGPGDIE